MPPVPQDQQYYQQFQGPGGTHHFLNGPGGGIMMLLMFFVVVAVGLLLVLVLMRRRHLHGPDSAFAGSAPHGSTAISVLEERLARGEIEPDDYKARRELLSSRG